jgi:hypothetical protein
VFINGKQIDEIPMISFPKIACNEPMDPYNNNNKNKNKNIGSQNTYS